MLHSKPAPFLTAAVLFVAFCLPSRSLAQADTTRCGSPGCHTALLAPATVHAPVLQGCESCHTRRGLEHPSGDGKEFPLSVSVPALCEQCHDASTRAGSVHAPFADGNCLACHAAHSAAAPKLLLADTPGALCSTCHDMERSGAVSLHAPARKRDCLACHDPHQSDRTVLLKDTTTVLCIGCHPKVGASVSGAHPHIPAGRDCRDCHVGHASAERNLLSMPVETLCLSCHDKVARSLRDGGTIHAPLSQKNSCLSCHTPHGSEQEHLVRAASPKLCFRCHGERSMDSPENGFVDMQKRIHGSAVVHAPVADGCGTCHDPHVSKNPALLRSAYPGSVYGQPADTAFALCFTCHDAALLLQSKMRPETDFRNGTTNLHSTHVMRPKAMRCSGCHDVHASDTRHLLANTVRFGKWNMPLNAALDKDGGTCTPGCHGTRSYRR
jgi:predicted CXXCH cytochrome family protein